MFSTFLMLIDGWVNVFIAYLWELLMSRVFFENPAYFQTEVCSSCAL